MYFAQDTLHLTLPHVYQAPCDRHGETRTSIYTTFIRCSVRRCRNVSERERMCIFHKNWAR